MSSFTNSILTLLTRDLHKLKEEISSYEKEENLWLVKSDISNSAGNLCLHLIGNLNAFIGAELGNTGYIRQREDEFGLKNVPRDEMLQMTDETIVMLKNVVPSISQEDLENEFPIVMSFGPIKTSLFLMHLCSHLTYHLGQINYHRRLLD